MEHAFIVTRKVRHKAAMSDSNYIQFQVAAAPTASWNATWPANPPGTTQMIVMDSAGTMAFQAIGGGGSVTSVGMSVPGFLNVSGSPVTTSGTLAVTLASQAQNLMFASPDGSTGTPTFRAMVAADIPSLTAAKISNFDTQVRTSRLDQMASPTASVAMGSQKITGLAEPTLSQDAATKNYVDSAVTAATRYKGVADASQSTVTLATGTSTWINGDMYRVTVAGTVFGFQTNIGDFAIYNGTTWNKIDNTDPAVTGTASRITVTATGDTSYAVDIHSSYVGQATITTLGTIATGTWTGTSIAVANGGTGATTASAARTNLAAAGMVKNTFTNASLTAGVLTVTHNLNNSAPTVTVMDQNGYQYFPDTVQATSANAVAIDFTTIGTLTGTHTYTIIG